MTRELRYVKIQWPDEVVPDGSPMWIYYEYDAELDSVLRIIETFKNKRSERNSLELEERDGYPCVSLVHGPFLEITLDLELIDVVAAEFEALWQSGIDKPYT